MPSHDLAPVESLQLRALQRADLGTGEEERDDEHPLQTLQRQAGNAAVTAALQRDEASPVLDVVGRGGGRPLAQSMRSDMESRLGSDFSDVRIHDDTAAQRSATAVGARAYTSGHEVVLGEGLSLDSADGQHTLAHELTHVVQQRQGAVDGTPTGDGVSISDPSDRFEQEAEATASRVMSGDTAPGPASAGAPAAVQGLSIQRGISIENVTDDEDQAGVQLMALQREELRDEEPELA